MVYLRNDGVPWKSDFASWRVRKTKSQPAGVFGTEGLRVMTVVAPPLKSSRGIKLGYETFGLYPIVSLAFKFEQYAVVAENVRFDKVSIYEFEIYVCRQVLFIGCGWFFNLHK
jgi:hypothetical protein